MKTRAIHYLGFVLTVALTVGWSYSSAQVLGTKVIPIGSSSMEPTFARAADVQIDLDSYIAAEPRRWDVVTYLSPENGKFWTHRVIGLPGDEIYYDSDKRLRINGVHVTLIPVRLAERSASQPTAKLFVEKFGTERHLVQLLPEKPALPPIGSTDLPASTHCRFNEANFTCVVPPEQYFLMGDNRDMSFDSRYLGFIPASVIGGRVRNVPEVPATQ